MYYEDIKDDHDLSHILDHVFFSTAHLNINNIDLDSNRRYVPKTDEENFFFKEMQILMYAVIEDHLNACTEGTSLYGQYSECHHMQRIYLEVKKHAITLFQYDTTTF